MTAEHDRQADEGAHEAATAAARRGGRLVGRREVEGGLLALVGGEGGGRGQQHAGDGRREGGHSSGEH